MRPFSGSDSHEQAFSLLRLIPAYPRVSLLGLERDTQGTVGLKATDCSSVVNSNASEVITAGLFITLQKNSSQYSLSETQGSRSHVERWSP
jgi:hypothetical protein